MAQLERMREEFSGVAEFVIVYVKEAHPGDEWQMEINEEENVVFSQPKRSRHGWKSLARSSTPWT